MAHDPSNNRRGPFDHEVDHQDRGEGRPVTFNQFDTTNYLHADNKADGSASEQFIHPEDECGRTERRRAMRRSLPTRTQLAATVDLLISGPFQKDGLAKHY